MWLVDDARPVSFVQGAQAGLRFTDPEKLGFMETFENVRPGGYIPEEAIKEMNSDGIDVAVLYPTEAAAIYRYVEDTDC